MNPTITVCLLVDIPQKPEPTSQVIRANLLSLETIRVGFPKSLLHVYVRQSQSHKLVDLIPQSKVDALTVVGDNLSHSDWIQYCLNRHKDTGTLVICDPDMVFYSSIEDWIFTPETLIAGNFIPQHYVPEAKVISKSRLHSSLLIFPNPQALRDKITKLLPISNNPNVGSYIPCEWWKPNIQYQNGIPFFWDCGSNLFHALSEVESSIFNSSQLSAYSHILGASWRWRLYGANSQEWYNAILKEFPEGLRNLWIKQQDYYTKQSGIAKQLIG